MKNKTVTLVEKMKKLQKSMRILADELEDDYIGKAGEIRGAADVLDSWITGIKNEK